MFGTIVLGTIISMAFVCVPFLFVAEDVRDDLGFTGAWVFWMFVMNFVLNAIAVYFFTPALLGPLAGYQWLWLTLAVDVVIGFIIGSAGKAVAIASAVGGLVGLVLTLVVLVFTVIFTTWTTPNAKQLAAFPNIVESTSPYPDSDPAHTPIVTEKIARYKGRQVLAQNGQNYGSIYHVEDYNLMAVNGHLYYVAPLVYNNIFANLQYQESPGMVVVDAEDPNADAFMKLDHKLHYLPAAIFNQDLVRHIYLNGYTNFKLTDPTLEVDDNWTPYFTVDLSEYVRGVTGGKVVGVLVVNSDTGEITRYNIGDEPAWIDRVMPGDTVEQYVTWWGKWHDAPWWNWSGQHTEQPAFSHPALIYNRADGYPAWQFILTSGSGADTSATGVILFDTKSNKGILYRDDAGFAVGDDVTHAMESNPKNIKNYEADGTALYNFFGKLTWLTTFESPTPSDAGVATFQALGLVESNQVQGDNIVMESTKEEALRTYQRWLADHGNNLTSGTEVNNQVTVEGYIDRFASDTQGGVSVYYFTVKDLQGNDVDHIFYGTSVTSEKLALTKVGDHVVIKFQDVNSRVVAVAAFNNLSINIPEINPTSGLPEGATAVPLPTFTPTLMPTATPTSLFEPHP